MEFERTHDYLLVRSILTLPAIYPWMGDDAAPPPEQFAVNKHPAIWYVLVRDRGKLIGLFCLFPANSICWEAHVAMLPKIPPSVTHQAGREIVLWIWDHAPCRRMTASVPVYNRAAVRFGKRAMGLVPYGVNPASFQKHGRLWNQVLMGVSRPGK